MFMSGPWNLWMWKHHLGKKVFAVVIKLKILRWDHPWRRRWVLNPTRSVFVRDGSEGTDTGEGHGKEKVGVIQPQTKVTWSCQKLEQARKDSPLGEPSVERWPCQQPWFNTSGLQNCERIINSCCLNKHQVYSTLLQKPFKGLVLFRKKIHWLNVCIHRWRKSQILVFIDNFPGLLDSTMDPSRDILP